MKTTTCKVCGTPFPTKTCGIYCSDDCSFAATGRRRKTYAEEKRRKKNIEDRGLAEADRFLAAAVRMETAPAWERHYQPWD